MASTFPQAVWQLLRACQGEADPQRRERPAAGAPAALASRKLKILRLHAPRIAERARPLTICSGVRFATRVRVEPGGFSFPASEKYCATWFPVQAPARLIAESPGGAVEAAPPVRMAGAGP